MNEIWSAIRAIMYIYFNIHSRNTRRQVGLSGPICNGLYMKNKPFLEKASDGYIPRARSIYSSIARDNYIFFIPDAAFSV